MNWQREDGTWAIDLTDHKEVVDAIRELTAQHEVGVEYKRSYYTRETGDEDLELIIDACHTLFSDGDVTVGRMAVALQLLMDSGRIQRKDFEPAVPLEEPKPDTTPRDKNGKPLSASQLKWSEFRQFADSASMDEINRRKRADSEFANFVRKSMERELANTVVGDAVTPEGQVVAPVSHGSSEPLTPQLREFARKYSKEPISNLRPKGGFVMLDGQQLSWAYFQDLLNKATAAGAIR
jgi:hypothetical protein